MVEGDFVLVFLCDIFLEETGFQAVIPRLRQKCQGSCTGA
jgi:hypothetical protein